MKKKSIQEVIDRVEDIPAFPMTVSRIIQLTEDPESTVQDIEKEITKDQSLTARVLRFANSTHYGYARKISTISQATVVLGFQAIKSIALAATVSKMMAQELPGYSMEKKALWNQSQTCAIAARLIAKKTRYPKPDEAYVAGLLRDVGKVVMNHYLKEQMAAVQDTVNREKVSFMEAEEKIIGFHHGQIGSKIAEKWNLPKDLVEAIAHHHEPEKASANKELVAITHLADAMVMMLGIQMGADGLQYSFSTRAMEMLNLTEIHMQELLSQLIDLMKDEDAYNS